MSRRILVKSKNSIIRSEIFVNGGNGHGSTNTHIRRFTNLVSSTGTDITYVDSAANGGSFTINRSGLYSIAYTDGGTGTVTYGVSVDSSQLTTTLITITDANRLISSHNGAANAWQTGSIVTRLVAGNVIRAHTDSSVDLTNIYSTLFRITRVGN